MRKTLFTLCLLCLGAMFAVAGWAESNHHSRDSDSQKVKKLNRRITEAQKEGDPKALQGAMEDYERFLDERPEFKTRLAELKAKDQQVSAHRAAAKEYIKNERYLRAVEEYKECLKIMDQKNSFFAIARANILLNIGRLYQSLADEHFRLILKENITPEVKKLMQTRIDKIKKNPLETEQVNDQNPKKP